MTQWGLDTIFNPAKRHMDEEKRRLQSTREEIGDSSGGKRIDLDSGKVVIARQPDSEDEAPDASTAAEAKADETTPAAPETKAPADPADDPTDETPAAAAARRARARRSG